MRMITGMLYSNVRSASTKKLVLAHPMKDGGVAKNNFEETRVAMDELANIEAKTMPQKMDVSSVEAATAIKSTHSEWVDWIQYGDYQIDDSAVDADSTSGAGSLDAFRRQGQKRKGQRERHG